MARTATSKTGQIDLFACADDLEAERERIAEINEERAARRGYLVFATDPEISPDEPGYRRVYATEARTPNQAVAKVRPIVEGRRLRAYLITGRSPGRARGGALGRLSEAPTMACDRPQASRPVSSPPGSSWWSIRDASSSADACWLGSARA